MFTGFSYTVNDAVHVFTVDTKTDSRDLHLRIRDEEGGFKILADVSAL